MSPAAGGVRAMAGCASLTPRSTATVMMADGPSITITTEPMTQAGAGIRMVVAGVPPRRGAAAVASTP
ncbi:hypothetical protein [Arthrobacter sp. AOP36-C1-22]|uniref:hypothetical protein n=1 Tax=Arthrobacter sp. AOP36-C1-22 TaxID=3457683 RepID=UPI0040332CB1